MSTKKNDQSATVPGAVFNKNQLAAAFAVDLKTVANWTNRGMPVLKRGDQGSEWAYSLVDVIEWRIARDVEAAVKKAESGAASGALNKHVERKAAAEAELVEYKLAEKRKSLVALKDVADYWSVIASNVRTRLLGVPASVAPLAHAAETTEEVQSVIEKAIHEAMEQLSASATGLFGLDSPSGEEDRGGEESDLDDQGEAE